MAPSAVASATCASELQIILKRTFNNLVHLQREHKTILHVHKNAGSSQCPQGMSPLSVQAQSNL